MGMDYGEWHTTRLPLRGVSKEIATSSKTEVQVLLEEKKILRQMYEKEKEVKEEVAEREVVLLKENIILRGKIEELEAEVNKIHSRFEILDL
ncbi:MAG TPA: hypothetical protein VMZ91_08905 [Candidatus Paceibacterota bacterium]|nr:hypothetical protein [Candidatus Paceibacterota bacterium]